MVTAACRSRAALLSMVSEWMRATVVSVVMAARSRVFPEWHFEWQMGARRWIPLKFVNLQPSEFAKVGVALVLAKFFGENRGTPAWGDIAVGGILTAIPLALIAKEPDRFEPYLDRSLAWHGLGRVDEAGSGVAAGRASRVRSWQTRCG